MTKYARIENGKTIDVVATPDPLPAWAADDAAWLAKQFPTLTGFVQVPDDTLPGATDNGDGTFTNPEIPVPEAVPQVLSALDFIRYAAGQLTPARVVEIEEGFRDHASADLRYAWKEYDKATSFTKEKVTEFLGAGVTASILNEAERNSVLDNWPT